MLGVPFYGRGPTWNDTDYKVYWEIVALDPTAPNKDLSNGYGYNGIPTMESKTSLALQSAGGIMIWELSGDTTGSTSLLAAIDRVVNGSATPSPTPTPTATPVPALTPTPTPTPTQLPDGTTEVTPPGSAVTASTSDGNLPANTVDNSLATRWSANGDGQWIRFDMGTVRTLAHVKLAFYSGNTRRSRFDLQVSTDGATWANVVTGALGSGTTTQEETFDFADANARYVRYLGHANTVNGWNSLTEVSLFGSACTSCPTPTPTTVAPTATPTPIAATPTPTPTTAPGGVARPFPQALAYPGTIKPTNATQQQMDDAVRSYYAYWKSAYVRASNGVTPGGGYYVNMKGTGGSGTEITTSEAHGYGMLVFALMAGDDPQAKTYFDGMFNMYDKHRSKVDSDLMSWVIDQTESTSKDSDSATDGDMDIAYALLLADKQWGSTGAINYLAHAKRIISNGLKGSDVGLSSHRTLLGDWNTGQQNQTRASDWMTDHMKAYRTATGDAFWDTGVSTIYGMISTMTANYAPATGLMPDFIINNPPQPAPPNFLEAPTDGDYSWNSCRYPWRVAVDVAHYNSPESRAAANKMLGWLKGATSSNPNNIRAGYKLNGTALTTDTSAAFTSPFIAAAIVDPAHQSFLNAGWTKINNWRAEYYGDSINLLTMLLISGNWWSPA